jgi:hypothetical protein
LPPPSLRPSPVGRNSEYAVAVRASIRACAWVPSRPGKSTIAAPLSGWDVPAVQRQPVRGREGHVLVFDA